MAAITIFRLNANHLDIQFEDGSRWDQKIRPPGNPRGMFALHARGGKFEWRELLRPAENLARFGGDRLAHRLADPEPLTAMLKACEGAMG